MKQLLAKVKKVCDQAEIYYTESEETTVEFRDAKLHDIESNYKSGYSLRIIKDGKLGFSYTRNLVNPDELIKNAVNSLKGKVEARYEFPSTITTLQLETFDPVLNDLTGKEMVEECSRLCNIFKNKTDAEIMVVAGKESENIRIMNSKGTDLSSKNGSYFLWMGLTYPGGASCIGRTLINKSFQTTPDELINEMIDLYNSSSEVVEPEGGKMEVLFMPNSIYTLNWRTLSGTSGKSVYEKVSPLSEKIGLKIFSKKITIFDDPQDDTHPWARSFDDEGVSTKTYTIVENGVLKNFYYNLEYAEKLGAHPAGHGYKTARWGGDSISLKPIPSLQHIKIHPGNTSLSEIIKSIDKGIILEGVMGAHSGNIPNGDYSVGVSPGIYVENGKILGRVKDAMIAGNVYETLKNVVTVEDKTHYTWSGIFPAILCDNMSVSTKK